MITALDEMLWHQLPTTMDHVGTSDPRFFDRFWFAAYAPDGSAAIQATIGVYRNMNVVDGAVAFIVNGKQHNLRLSRELGGCNEMRCGPLRIEVLEPLRELRVMIDENESTSIFGALTWKAIAAPVEENLHFERKRGRIVQEYCRYNQIGTATGSIEVDGVRHDISNWWACRDHSWGARPGAGIPEPRTGASPSLDQKGFTMAFLFFSTTDVAGTMLFMQREGEDSYTSGTMEVLASGEVQHIQRMSLTPQLEEGTRRFRSVGINVTTDTGSTMRVQCHRTGSAFALQGLGYSGGYDDKKGLGVWRGTNAMECDIWDVKDPSRIIYSDGTHDHHWHRIQPVVLHVTDANGTSAGQGSMTLILSGAIPGLGLE